MTRTSDIPVLSLKKVGDAATLLIESCEKMKIGTYPEVEFIGIVEDGRIYSIRVPQKSADRQLERLGLTYQAAAGETLTFARTDSGDPSKPYWDIVRADEPITASARPKSVPATPPAPQRDEPAPTRREQEEAAQPKKKGSALYKEITEYVLDKVVPLYKEHGITPTMEGTAAICATLYIQANR